MNKDDSPQSGAPWSVQVIVEDIPESGLRVDLDAPPDVCGAVAALADLHEVPQLSATFDLTRRGARVHVSGRVQARVGQTCVVSLDPIENAVDEPVELVFAPGPVALPPGDPGVEVGLDAADEPPEPLIDGKIDLGALATEFLILGLDPYPRKPGVEFSPPKVDHGGEHPFSALAALKTRRDRGQS